MAKTHPVRLERSSLAGKSHPLCFERSLPWGENTFALLEAHFLRERRPSALLGALVAWGENTFALLGVHFLRERRPSALLGAFIAPGENTMALLGVCFPRRRRPSAPSPGLLPHRHTGTDHIFLTVRVMPW